jgi:hypothetical protein
VDREGWRRRKERGGAGRERERRRERKRVEERQRDRETDRETDRQRGRESGAGTLRDEGDHFKDEMRQLARTQVERG